MKFNRQAAVQLAMKEYWKKGYSNVSVNGLCTRLGITRSSFYNTFRSLDDLFDEVVALYMTGAPWHMIARVPDFADLTSPTAQIRASYRVLCKMRAEDPDAKGCLLVNSMGSLATLSEPSRKTVLATLARSRSEFDVMIAKAHEAGELPPDCDLSHIGDALQALSIAINTVSKVIRSEDRLWALASATLDGVGLTEAAAVKG
jgi:TetR/AcrR family transcriptional repressor of nem operon